MTHVPQKILVAVAWPYASGPRHLGHVAGPGVPSDIFARYHRLKGNDVLMVSGTDEHGTPVMVAADREGVSPRELADRNNALILDDYVRLGLSFDTFTRTTTRNHYEVTQDVFRTLLRERLPLRADDARRGLPRDRPHAARPLHRGHVPDLRLPGGARRPVRQLRQPARPRRPDRAALDHRRLDAGVPRDDAPVPRPARIPGPPRRVDRVADALAAERPQLRAQPRTRGEAARDDPRHRLGRPRPGRHATPRTRSGSTCGSTPSSATCRRPSSGRTTRGTPDAWREWWQNPESRHFYFMGKDNIVFHAVIWPSMLMGYGSGGESARARATSSCRTTSSRAST